MHYKRYDSYMHVITVANTKGGVGKTTTAVYLAIAAHKENPETHVTLLDLDPQGSATAWAEIAQRANNDPLPVEVKSGTLQELQKLRKLQDTGVIIVDTPTGDGRLLERLVSLSDIVVIPTQTEGLGLARTYATLRVVGDKGAVILTQVRKRTKLYAEGKQSLEDYLNDHEWVIFDTEIPDGVRYKAYGTNPSNTGEYANAWQEIKETLNA